MNHALDASMFWVGALFAFTPIVLGGVVIGIWWWMRKRGALDEPPVRGPASPGPPVQR
ncbi:MAG TPA: hypothetical protein VGA02_11375 [Gemmatimonadales bacterium]|jgi:uncharacterized membrane protein